MDGFIPVLGTALFAAFLTCLEAPIAERLDVPHRVGSATLQFAAGRNPALLTLVIK